MPAPIRTSSHGRATLAVALLFAAALAGSASARADVQVYEVTVPLDGTTADDRAAGMAAALRAVAVMASGRREAADDPAVNRANPSKYVQRYSTTAEKTLKVGFDGQAVEQLLQQAGLPLWPVERPLTVIRATVPDPAVVEAAARWRGLPIAWSTGDDVAASAARAVLTGVPSGAEFEWTFAHDGRTTRTRGSAQDGVHLAADTLASRYAPLSTRSTSNLTLRVGGMDDLADYSGLLAYLRELSLVRDVEVVSLDGDVIALQVSLKGDRELLGRVVALDGRLRPGARDGEGAAQAVDFVYQP